MPPRLPGQIGALMQESAFGGQAVFRPGLLEVNQRPLPRAEGEMLQPLIGSASSRSGSLAAVVGRASDVAPGGDAGQGFSAVLRLGDARRLVFALTVLNVPF